MRRTLLSSRTFQALHVALALRRAEDERTLRQAAGLSGLFFGGGEEVRDVPALDEALRRSSSSGVDGKVLLAAQRKRASVISAAPPADVPSSRPSLFGGGAARKTVHWSEEQPQVFAVLNWQRRASETEEEAATERPFPQLLAELFGSWRCGFGG